MTPPTRPPLGSPGSIVKARSVNPHELQPDPLVPLLATVPIIAICNLIGFSFDAPHVTLLSTIALELSMIYWGYRFRPYGIILIFFTISCFTFLTGRLLVVGLLGYRRTEEQPWGLHINDAATVNGVLLMQETFLVVIWLTLVALSSRRQRLISRLSFAPNRIGIQIGFASMLVGSALYLQNRLSVVSQVSSTSYYEYYASQSSLVTTSGRIGGSLLLVGFSFVLAANPRFRPFLIASGILIVNHGLDLVMGRRADFVLTVLVVAFYALFRSSAESGLERHGWPRTQRLGLLSLLAFPLIALLNIVNRIRDPQSTALATDPTGLNEFFYSQGVTANILAYIQTDTLNLPTDRLYSLGPLTEFIQTRLVPGFDASIYQGQTAERAITGHQFADIFSYRIMPTLYEQGAGYGSSAVAELYWDFGWIGIVVGGLIIGFLMSYSGLLGRFVLPVSAVFYLIVRDLMYIPRAPFLHWLVGALNVYNILAIVVLTVLVYAVRQASSRSNGGLRPGSHSTTVVRSDT